MLLFFFSDGQAKGVENASLEEKKRYFLSMAFHKQDHLALRRVTV